MHEMQREEGGRRPLCEELGLSDLQRVYICANPTSVHPYLSRKERKQKKAVNDSPASATPIFVDPSEDTFWDS